MTVAAIMTFSMAVPAFAENENGGWWSDRNMDNLTWTYEDDPTGIPDGTTLVLGRGNIFATQHPEVTDPEYCLKQVVFYPGEDRMQFDENGNQLKRDVSDEALQELQKFVNSFDWIHSDELTRAQAVWNRVACNNKDRVYGIPDHSRGVLPIIQNGVGKCGDYSEEFQLVARSVGLECELYIPSFLHQACMIKIGDQWLTIDPTQGGVNGSGEGTGAFLNSMFTPVDFETEYYSYDRSGLAKKKLEERRAAGGQMTYWEYYKICEPDWSDEELLSWIETVGVAPDDIVEF